MASVLDFLTQLDTALAALSPALATAAAHSDHRSDLDDLAPGSTHFRMRHQQQNGIADSNQTIESVAVEIEVSHHLADHFDERAYTRGDMLTHQASLLDSDWWRLAAVRSVTGAPQLEVDVAREGNVVFWSVLAIVAITPDP